MKKMTKQGWREEGKVVVKTQERRSNGTFCPLAVNNDETARRVWEMVTDVIASVLSLGAL